MLEHPDVKIQDWAFIVSGDWLSDLFRPAVSAQQL